MNSHSPVLAVLKARWFQGMVVLAIVNLAVKRGVDAQLSGTGAMYASAGISVITLLVLVFLIRLAVRSAKSERSLSDDASN